MRHRWLLIGLTLILSAAAGYGASVGLRFESGIGDIDPSMNAGQPVLERMEALFGRDAPWIVVAEGDVFDEAFLRRLGALREDLEGCELDVGPAGERTTRAMFEPPFSLLDGWTTRFVEGRAVVERYFHPLPTGEALRRLRERVLADPVLAGSIVDERGRHTAIVLQTTSAVALADHGRVRAALLELIERHEAPGFALSLAGEPALIAEFNHRLVHDTPLLVLITVGLLVLLGAVSFRHVLGVLGPLSVVVLAAAGTFGVMAVVGLPLSTVTTIIPVLLFCVALGGSVHLISAFRDLRGEGLETDDAVVGALATTGVPIVFTAVTTMVGLASFRLAGIGIIRDMGVSAAIGVALTLAHTLVMLPCLLTFTRRGLKVRRGEGDADLIDRVIGRCRRLAGLEGDRRARAATLWVTLSLVVLAAVGSSRLRLGYDPLRRVPAEASVHRGFEIMDQYLGGTSTVSLLVEADDPATLRRFETVEALAAVEADLQRYEDPEEGRVIGPSTGWLELLRGARRALDGGDPGAFRLPRDQRELDEALAALDEAPAALLDPVVARGGRAVRVGFRVRHIDALGYEPLAAHVERSIAAHAVAGVRVAATGSLYVDMAVSNLVTRDLVRSFGIAFLVVSLLMIVVLRDPALGLLAMVPNLLPIGLVMGVMGFAGLRSDIDTILIASIALGIVVDDTIHLLHQYRTFVASGVGPEEALGRAMGASGRAVVATSVIIVLGFLVLLASSLSNVRIFGLLVSLITALALVCDLVVTPALIGGFAARRRRLMRSDEVGDEG